MFKFLNQCFARLRFWKSVSDSRNLLDGATAVWLETLFQNPSRAKHWFKNLNILISWIRDVSELVKKMWKAIETKRQYNLRPLEKCFIVLVGIWGFWNLQLFFHLGISAVICRPGYFSCTICVKTTLKF